MHSQCEIFTKCDFYMDIQCWEWEPRVTHVKHIIGCVNTLAFSCWQGKLTPHINTVMEQIWFAVAELTELCTAALEKKLIAAFSGSPISIIALFNRCDGGIFIWMQADLLGRVPDRHVNMTSPTKPGQSLFFIKAATFQTHSAKWIHLSKFVSFKRDLTENIWSLYSESQNTT